MSMTFRLSFGSAAMHVIQNVDDTCSFWITCVAAEDAKQMDAGDGASGDAGDGCQCWGGHSFLLSTDNRSSSKTRSHPQFWPSQGYKQSLWSTGTCLEWMLRLLWWEITTELLHCSWQHLCLQQEPIAPQVVCEVDLHGCICHSDPFVSHQGFLLLKL